MWWVSNLKVKSGRFLTSFEVSLSNMISFSSFPTENEHDGYNHPHHPHDPGDDVEMDENYLESNESKLTCPGESLTSSQMYMRYVFRPLLCHRV